MTIALGLLGTFKERVMSDIKVGDLVLIVGGPSDSHGKIGSVMAAGLVNRYGWSLCVEVAGGDKNYLAIHEVIKIDPQAEGDSLPAHANLDQPVTA
jgi:hypothetical protein